MFGHYAAAVEFNDRSGAAFGFDAEEFGAGDELVGLGGTGWLVSGGTRAGGSRTGFDARGCRVIGYRVVGRRVIGRRVIGYRVIGRRVIGRRVIGGGGGRGRRLEHREFDLNSLTRRQHDLAGSDITRWSDNAHAS